MKKRKELSNVLLFILLLVISCVFVFPIILVLMNSFKGKLYINTTPFILPNKESFAGFRNYTNGLKGIHFFRCAWYSFFITVGSIILITIFCSMSAWCITRIKSKWSSVLYYLYVGAMIVPFQMIMYTLTRVANILNLTNLIGILFIYLGIGSGLSIFIISGFVKTVPIELEEAALIDGCNPVTTFTRIVFPILKPILVTVAVLNAMWIWNDYMLPFLIIGSKCRTIPIAVQNMRTDHGSIDYGHLMAVIIVALIPVSAFYFTCQRYIVESVVAGAIKG